MSPAAREVMDTLAMLRMFNIRSWCSTSSCTMWYFRLLLREVRRSPAMWLMFLVQRLLSALPSMMLRGGWLPNPKMAMVSRITFTCSTSLSCAVSTWVIVCTGSFPRRIPAVGHKKRSLQTQVACWCMCFVKILSVSLERYCLKEATVMMTLLQMGQVHSVPVARDVVTAARSSLMISLCV